MTKRRGSALVIALLLIAVIGGLAFGIGRLVFLEAATAAAYENGSVAYFAAESGIEEGFLRYRYDRNAEIPQGTVGIPGSYWTLGGTKVYRNNLTDTSAAPSTGANYAGILPTVDITNNVQQFYDLKMGFVGTNGNPWYGQELTYPPTNYNLSADSSTTITADNTKKIDVTPMNLSAQSLTLFGKFSAAISDPKAVAANCKAFIEVTLTIQYSGSTKIDQYKDFYVNDANGCASFLKVDASKLSPMVYDNSTNTFSVLNIDKAILAKAGAPIPVLATPPTKVAITIKPLYNSMAFGLTANCQNVTCAAGTSFTHLTAVPGPFTTITSTGYYGGASRKILANIDRESGTLYDLYDYVLFKGN